jgi:DNA-binding CsgD family transcriptional regulator
MRTPAPPPQRLAGDRMPANCGPFQRSTVLIALLTPAQRRAVRARAAADSIEDAAEELGISPQTIKKHLSAAMQTANACDFLDLLRNLEWLRVPPQMD